ncbi:MAG: PKD domain-containing protein, partial [Thermoplasmatales archaeon]|nr:PKD domain-containing protein [Thermoplasmatales archaeon]
IPNESVVSSRGSVTIYVNTSAIDARTDLNSTQKTALKNRILQHLRDNYNDAVGSANVTITNDPSQAGSANRTIQIQPGMDPKRPKSAAWGRWPHKSNTTYVYLGEFMNDSSVNGSFKDADGKWNTTKLGNAIGHTAGHEVGHSFSIGHNHKEGPKRNANDNRSKMTVGTNLNASERANASFKFDNHSKDVLKKNWGKPPCDSTADYDEKVLISHFWDGPLLPDKPDEGGTLDALFLPYAEMPGGYEFGFLGQDTDNGIIDGNPDFDFVYKSSLMMDDTDAEIISFMEDHHEHTSWLLRGSETSPYPGEWFTVNPDNVLLEEFIENPDGDFVARFATMTWPEQGVFITLDSYSFGDESCPYNGFTYGYVPTVPEITGPESGEPGVEYNFTIVSTDPTGLNVFYYIDWGDGEIEEWIGPFPSGVDQIISHIFEEPATYSIRAKAKNTNGGESLWSDDHKIVIIPSVELEIGEIIGGLLGISVEIKNNGSSNATNVISSIILEGGIILIGREISENIGTIEAGSTGAIFDIPVLGFGPVEITITASADGVEEVTRTGRGFVLLFYIIISIP